jgi:hypothetical protein
MDYPGKVITKTQVTPTQTSASGNWTLDDQAAAIKNNNWPVAGVPNPISKSLRFNSADSTYLNRTLTTPTNNLIWTWSAWVKRCDNANPYLFTTTATDGSGGYIYFASGTLVYWDDRQAGNATVLQTSAVYRDQSAWYHFMVVTDRTQATASNRAKIYVNGSQVTNFNATAYPNQNEASQFNSAIPHYITAPSSFFNGYMTEINFIDGQALDASSFGLTNPQTGQWIPKKYTGTYGTNGFYLNFKDATSTTTLGYDYSGNANNWTTNNFSVTAGSGNDSLTDVPTPWVAYSATGDVGGVIRGNYCTWNPLRNDQNAVLSNGNLDLSTAGSTSRYGTYTTLGVSSAKWYWEITAGSLSTDGYNIGIASASKGATSPLGSDTQSYIYLSNGDKRTNATTAAYGATYTAGDVIGVALDLDAGTLVFYKNGSSQGTAYSSIPSNTWFPTVADDATASTTGSSFVANFGQRPFAYTPPAGFRSLCTTNLPATTIGFGLTNQADDYFNTVIFTGNSTSDRTITTGLQSDFVWAKRRNDAYSHLLFDAIRGAGRTLRSDSTNIESNDGGFYVQQFNSDNYLIGATDQALNHSSGTYVSWVWNAGGSNATNTAGTVTSTVRANTTAGFSIVTWTGAAAGDTIGHGLGAAPSLIITKTRTDNTAQPWPVYHRSLGRGKYLTLNTTAAENASYSTYWGNSEPSSTIFGTLTIAQGANNIGNMVAYCFAPVAGYSAIGSYTGNGSSDGPFVYLGFRPAFLMVKRTDSTGTWVIIDSKRNTYNPENLELYPNTTAAEGNGGTTYIEDFLSNGFKIRQTDTTWNASGGTYIYAAFAESPFQFANAR